MKKLTLIVLLISFSCFAQKRNTPEKRVSKDGFQRLIDSLNLEGAILIYDLNNNVFYTNNFDRAKKTKLPASTFKIPNSIIGLETGILNENAVFKWDGKKRAFKIWEQDLKLQKAFQYSCVPCYQELARQIGKKRMNEYLQKLDFGNMNVTATNIDNFWLKGTSNINQFQQIDFLKRLYKSELPISKKTNKIIKKIMIINQNKEFTLRGKTGWSVTKKQNNGWFVGYVETKNNVFFFATNIEPKQGFDMKKFSKIRKEITLIILKKMNIIKIIQ